MAIQKLVARYTDGRLVKGHTSNFNPAAASFTLTPVEGPESKTPMTVDVRSLKAVFFVRDFAGNPDYQEESDFVPGVPYNGRRVKVSFADGEELLGATPSYDSSAPGFFVFPCDTKSNTIKVYAVNAAIRSVRML